MRRLEELRREIASEEAREAEEAAALAAGYQSVFDMRQAAEAAKQAEHDWTPFMADLRALCARYDVELWSCGCCDGINAVHDDYTLSNIYIPKATMT